MSTSLFVFTGPVWCRPSVSNYSCCGFLITVAGSCLKYSTFPCLLAVTFFLPLFHKLPWALEWVVYDLFRAEPSPSLCLGTGQPRVFEATIIYCKLTCKYFFLSLSVLSIETYSWLRDDALSLLRKPFGAPLSSTASTFQNILLLPTSGGTKHVGFTHLPPVIPTRVLHMQNWQEVTRGSVSLCTLTKIWVLSIPPQKGPQRRTPFI